MPFWIRRPALQAMMGENAMRGVVPARRAGLAAQAHKACRGLRLAFLPFHPHTNSKRAMRSLQMLWGSEERKRARERRTEEFRGKREKLTDLSRTSPLCTGWIQVTLRCGNTESPLSQTECKWEWERAQGTARDGCTGQGKRPSPPHTATAKRRRVLPSAAEGAPTNTEQASAAAAATRCSGEACLRNSGELTASRGICPPATYCLQTPGLSPGNSTAPPTVGGAEHREQHRTSHSRRG